MKDTGIQLLLIGKFYQEGKDQIDYGKPYRKLIKSGGKLEKIFLQYEGPKTALKNVNTSKLNPKKIDNLQEVLVAN